MILDGDQEKLGEYVREMADLCGLRDWTVQVDTTPAEDHEAGTCRVTYGRKFGMIRMASDWSGENAESIRQTVTHELLHMHAESVFWSLNNVQDVLGSSAFTVLEGSVRDALEVMVDSVATVLAERLPLPVKGKPNRKKGKG